MGMPECNIGKIGAAKVEINKMFIKGADRFWESFVFVACL